MQPIITGLIVDRWDEMASHGRPPAQALGSAVYAMDTANYTAASRAPPTRWNHCRPCMRPRRRAHPPAPCPPRPQHRGRRHRPRHGRSSQPHYNRCRVQPQVRHRAHTRICTYCPRVHSTVHALVGDACALPLHSLQPIAGVLSTFGLQQMPSPAQVCAW